MTATTSPADDLKIALVARFAGFFGFLRARGLAVGIGEELDLAHALEYVPLLDREAFLSACRITLAKSPWDLARLEEAFNEYWSSSWSPPGPSPAMRIVAPARPLPDSTPSPSTFSQSPPGTVDRVSVVRVGVYSPNAPPAGHVIARLDRKRTAGILAGARRFRRFAATLPGRRYAPSRSGDMDFRATARQSMRNGGEWLQVRRRKRKRLRAELLILWDISGSMREHDSELFAIAYSLHRSVRRSRVFAFSTRLEEITGLFRGRAYPRAADAVSQTLGSAGGGTRIGRCLEDFMREYGALIRPWTTLVVLSDGWDLGETDLLGRVLERLHQRCHLLVWVNPYANEPDFQPATAGMQAALPHLDSFLAPLNFESARPF